MLPQSQSRSHDLAQNHARERLHAQDITNQSLSNGLAASAVSKPDHQAYPIPTDDSKAARNTPAEFSVDINIDIVHHEDFEELVYLAFQVRCLHQQILNETGCSYTYCAFPELATNSSNAEEVLQSAARITGEASSNPGSRRFHATLRRGENPTADVFLKNSQDSLELQLADMQRHQEGLTLLSLANARTGMKKGKGGAKTKKEAIAIKYSHRQTTVLMDWMIKHKESPFPDTKAIACLMKKTELTQIQVVNWTTNVRRRSRKATCEGGKKPHHFIDFFFLAHDICRKRKRLGWGLTQNRDKAVGAGPLAGPTAVHHVAGTPGSAFSNAMGREQEQQGTR
jgi:hypothetical protein